ncbi:MAG TPA: hypothetical protein VFQ53_36240 [Kofleriaceae bacterium]|nr:hypothetical protein [Kofleriaceae bacterium]
MHRPGLVVAIALVVPALAHAEPSVTESAPEHRAAIAVNPPFRWLDGNAFAVSAYGAVTDHLVVRGNVSRYDYDLNAVAALIEIAGQAEDEGSYRGHVTDLGAGVMWFPRALWSGPTLEGGLLVRARDLGYQDAFASPPDLETHTTVVAGRALAGWSWLLGDRAFVSFAVGLSVGREWGKEIAMPDELDPRMVEANVDRRYLSAEGFGRIGVAFGL